MGQALPVIPATIWELTRRCTGRQFLLRPDREVVEAVLYSVAYSADRWGILVHWILLMMDHYHDGVTDTRGTRVEFITEAHGLIARCIKSMRGQDGTPMEGEVWAASEQTGRVLLVSEEGAIDACAYALANPVTAGLVHNLGDWPSFASRPRDMLENRAITIKRPACLPEQYPATVTLRFCVPPAFSDHAEAFVQATEERLKEKLRIGRKAASEARRRYKTRAELLSVSPFDAPKTRKRKNGIIPALRAADRAVMQESKRRLVAWRRAYRAAFEAFRVGKRKVEWPAGTWFYAKYAGVRVAPLGTWATFGVG